MKTATLLILAGAWASAEASVALPRLPVTVEIWDQAEQKDNFCQSHTLRSALEQRAFESAILINPRRTGNSRLRLECREFARHVVLELWHKGYFGNPNWHRVHEFTLRKPADSKYDLWATLIAHHLRSSRVVIKAALEAARTESLFSIFSLNRLWNEQRWTEVLNYLHAEILYQPRLSPRWYHVMSTVYRNLGMPVQAFWAFQAHEMIPEEGEGSNVENLQVPPPLTPEVLEAHLIRLAEGSQSSLSVAEVEQETRRLLGDVRERVEQRDYSGALKRLHQLLVYTPWSGETYQLLGELYWELGWEDLADNARRQAERISSMEAQALR